jgi:hypothetical protein
MKTQSCIGCLQGSGREYCAPPSAYQTREHFSKDGFGCMRDFRGNRSCFVVLSHAQLWINNGHPASVVVESQTVTNDILLISHRCELRTRWSAVRIRPGAQKSFHSIRELAPPPLTRLAPKPGGCGAFWGLCIAHFLGGLDQARQLGLGVVRRDATTAVPEQVLTILERHTRRA